MDFPLDLWVAVFDAVVAPGDAAALACVCRDTATAYRHSRVFRVPRLSRKGEVREPASGTFDAVVLPTECLRTALLLCPSGGSVLLTPGDHVCLFAPTHEVHVFGRGAAVLHGPVHVFAREASLVGVTIANEVVVSRGRARLQQCTLHNVVAVFGGSDPTFDRCRMFGRIGVSEAGTKGLFERCTITNHTCIYANAAPVFRDNTVRCGASSFAFNVESANVTLVSNRIEGVRCSSTFAIRLCAASTECVIERNTIVACAIGIQLVGQSEARIVDNDLSDVHDSVSLHTGSTATCTGNRICGAGRRAGCGLMIVDAGTGGAFTYTELSNHAICAFVARGADPVLTDNVFSASEYGVFALQSPACVYLRNRMRDVVIRVYTRRRQCVARVGMACVCLMCGAYVRMFGLDMRGLLFALVSVGCVTCVFDLLH